jgi:hypothetical protein
LIPHYDFSGWISGSQDRLTLRRDDLAMDKLGAPSFPAGFP